MESSEASDEFDVARESALGYSTLRRFRWVWGIAGSIIGSLYVWRAIPFVLSRQSIDQYALFYLAFFPILVVCFAFAFFAFAPGATSVIVSDVGVKLRYRRGNYSIFKWEKQRFRMTLWRYASDASTPHRELYVDTIRTLIPLSNPVSPQAFDRILGEAEKRGLRVTRRQVTWQGPPIRMRVGIVRP